MVELVGWLVGSLVGSLSDARPFPCQMHFPPCQMHFPPIPPRTHAPVVPGALSRASTLANPRTCRPGCPEQSFFRRESMHLASQVPRAEPPPSRTHAPVVPGAPSRASTVANPRTCRPRCPAHSVHPRKPTHLSFQVPRAAPSPSRTHAFVVTGAPRTASTLTNPRTCLPRCPEQSLHPRVSTHLSSQVPLAEPLPSRTHAPGVPDAPSRASTLANPRTCRPRCP